MDFRVFKKYNIVYGEGIVTPAGRISFPSLVTPKEPLPPKDGQAPGTPKYEVSLLLSKKDPSVIAFVEELEGYAEEMVPLYNQNAQNEIAKVKKILKDGDNSDHEKYPHEKGCWILTARSKDMPDLLGKDPSFFKSGMSCRLVVEPSLSSGGLGFGLKIVQLVSDDGVRFAGTKQDYRSLLEDLNGGSHGDETEEEESEEQENAEPVVEKKSAVQLARERAEQAASAKKGGKGKAQAVKLL